MNEDYLCHHGVKGMKWGRRKQKVSSKSVKTSSKSNKASQIKKKISNTLSKIDKDKVKKVAKTAAVVAGGVAVSSVLGYYGYRALSSAISTGQLSGYLNKDFMGPTHGPSATINGGSPYFNPDNYRKRKLGSSGVYSIYESIGKRK